MIEHDVVQGSREWHERRTVTGPTAGQFHRILTPRTQKLSTQIKPYICELLVAERLGPLVNDEKSQFMDRGSELEADAIKFYRFMRSDRETREVGFVTLDDGSAGCSPDLLVDEAGGLEIKCLSAPKHVQAVLWPPDDYVCQIQGCMWITEREWWELLCYNPAMDSCLKRFHRDEAFIDKLASAVAQFNEHLAEARARFNAISPPRQPAPELSLDEIGFPGEEYANVG
jgi:hypothetical protein